MFEQERTLIIDSNLHVFLSNIELGQMSEEAGVDTGLRMMKDERVNEEKGSQEKNSPLGKHSAVIMTSGGSVRGSTPERGTRA